MGSHIDGLQGSSHSKTKETDSSPRQLECVNLQTRPSRIKTFHQDHIGKVGKGGQTITPMCSLMCEKHKRGQRLPCHAVFSRMRELIKQA